MNVERMVVCIRSEVWCRVSRHRGRLVLSVMRERCQLVRDGALTTENSAELKDGELKFYVSFCEI